MLGSPSIDRPLTSKKLPALLFLLWVLSWAPAAAADGGGVLAPVDVRWAGHLKLRGLATAQPAASVYRTVGPDTYLDASLEGRLKNTLFWGNRLRFDGHYEVVASAGDTTEAAAALESLLDGAVPEGIRRVGPPSDDRRLMHLTRILCSDDGAALYHRLDRLALTLSPDWGSITAGRQAVTWGNGFLFHPMDLFNPFSPTDIDRDYKLGDDMLFVQTTAGANGNLQMLYVPRREAAGGAVVWDAASLAAKAHFFKGAGEFDLMAAKHYKDYVVGLGGAGYLADAAWRMDVTWTVLDRDNPRADYLSLVANIDYSWIWGGKNLYGATEFFYNGIGKDDPFEALVDPAIIERIGRGELFTLGTYYLAGHLRLEAHPLINLFCTAIVNLGDPSGIVQPRLTWDVIEDAQLLVGANLTWGADGTEYGGIPIRGTSYTTRPGNSVYAWLAYYF
jgi:hypothetical protein